MYLASHLFEVLPRHLRALLAATDRADRIEGILQLHLSGLHRPVQGALLQGTVPGCAQGEHGVLADLLGSH